MTCYQTEKKHNLRSCLDDFYVVSPGGQPLGVPNLAIVRQCGPQQLAVTQVNNDSMQILSVELNRVPNSS